MKYTDRQKCRERQLLASFNNIFSIAPVASGIFPLRWRLTFYSGLGEDFPEDYMPQKPTDGREVPPFFVAKIFLPTTN